MQYRPCSESSEIPSAAMPLCKLQQRHKDGNMVELEKTQMFGNLQTLWQEKKSKADLRSPAAHGSGPAVQC